MKYIVSADDRCSYQSFSKSIAEEAKRAQEAGLSVDIAFKTTELTGGRS